MQRLLAVEYDESVNASYLRFRTGKVKRTETNSVLNVNTDLNARGEVVGIEMLSFDDLAIRHVLNLAQGFNLDLSPLFKRPLKVNRGDCGV